MTKVKGFGERPKTQLRRFSYKGNAISVVEEYSHPGMYEVGVFFKNGSSYVERFLTKKEAITLYRYYKNMIKGMVGGH